MLLCNYKQLFFYGEQYITRLNVIGPGTPRLCKWISGSKLYAEISLEVNFVMRFNACSALSTNKFRSCRKWCERGTVSELETRCLFLSFTVTAYKVICQRADRWAGWYYWKKKRKLRCRAPSTVLKTGLVTCVMKASIYLRGNRLLVISSPPQCILLGEVWSQLQEQGEKSSGKSWLQSEYCFHGWN